MTSAEYSKYAETAKLAMMEKKYKFKLCWHGTVVGSSLLFNVNI
jgi:hypothetical protein